MFKALNIAILELDHKFKFEPFSYIHFGPLWKNLYEVYHPQDFLGEYSKS